MEPVLPNLLAGPCSAAGSPPRLVALFRGEIEFDVAELVGALRNLHPDLADVVVTWDGSRGEVAWGRHRLRLAGLLAPLPADRVEACLRSAHWPNAFKNAARGHTSHLFLNYAGDETEPLEQMAALALVAAALAPQGAWALLNEDAQNCFPADLLWDEIQADSAGDAIQLLRDLPLPWLYAGFVKYEIAGEQCIWMRTVGHHRFGLPDLAWRANGDHETPETVELFTHLIGYQRESGQALAPGHFVNVGPDYFLRLREPAEDEFFLDNPGPMLVVEPARRDEIDPDLLREPAP